MSKPRKFRSEFISDADTDERGLVIWLGTKNKRKAIERARKIIRVFNRSLRKKPKGGK